MCRKWNGSPSMTVSSCGDVEIKGEENLSVYGSSEWAERGFCKICGGHIFYRLKDLSLNFCHFFLGALENQTEFKFDKQIFVDSKPAHYSFSEKTSMLTEEEVFSAFEIADADEET